MSFSYEKTSISNAVFLLKTIEDKWMKQVLAQPNSCKLRLAPRDRSAAMMAFVSDTKREIRGGGTLYPHTQ
ncbi:MAG: hypothetical protein DRO87_03635 [Candidatus Thorarchaeota archaeon]|nr:MAG: hypothetical protein DRP09_05830 [Candidatus Thorarchaeota archaeon]RLI59216.1 MAG: hypothetical protein DRO87_03635 [Candidatus Thorarchaeota archaeon]